MHELNDPHSVQSPALSVLVLAIAAIHLGPDFILVAVDLLPAEGGVADRELAPDVERHLKSVDARISDVMFRFASPSFQEVIP